jgi:hypothetical protein
MMTSSFCRVEAGISSLCGHDGILERVGAGTGSLSGELADSRFDDFPGGRHVLLVTRDS